MIRSISVASSVTEQLCAQVFERSSFRNEAGAAISLTPNGARLLHRWGFDPEKARGIANIQVSDIRRGTPGRLCQAFPLPRFSNGKSTSGQARLP